MVKETDPLTIVIAYFLETIIIGVVYALKLYNILLFKNNKSLQPIFNFLLKFMFFVAVQLIFVFAFLKLNNHHIDKAYYLLENISYILKFNGMAYVLISMFVYNLADFIINFNHLKRYKNTPIKSIVIIPFKRILVQQFAVILACFFYFFVSGILAVAIVLILVRTWMDLYFSDYSAKKLL